MSRSNIEKHILKIYGCAPQYLWLKFPNYAVYRHSENRKWFAVVMDIPKRKLGINQDGIIDIINVKCDPLLIGSLLKEKFFSAYHMNKGTWITIALDGSVKAEEVKWLIDISFDLTKK